MSYTNSDEFKNPQTGFTDWERYHKAQQANGEKCMQCSQYILFGRTGYPRTCYECDALNRRADVEHHSRIRCPACGHNWQVEDLYEQGQHSVACDLCDCEFSVETKISYSFVSPERISEPDEEEVEGDAA